MKRIINIALIACAIATIGTVDAKQTKNRRQTSIITPMEQQPVTNIAAQIVQASEQVAENQNADTIQELTQALAPENQSPEQRELIVLKNEKEIIKTRIEFRTKEISSINYGWFGYGLTKETKDKYQNAKKLRKNLEKVLAEVQTEIDTLEEVTGKNYSTAIDAALTALKIAGVGIIATAVDHYIFKGAVRTFIGTNASKAYDKLPSFATEATTQSTEPIDIPATKKMVPQTTNKQLFQQYQRQQLRNK